MGPYFFLSAFWAHDLYHLVNYSDATQRTPGQHGCVQGAMSRCRNLVHRQEHPFFSIIFGENYC